jgi:hypothetical protein
MAAAIEPFILRLPNEVLERIFSFISYFERCPGGRGPDGRDFGGVTLFALSHVCRNFRRVIQNSPFWLAKSFQVADLRKGDYWARGGPAPHRDNFLAALLSDSNLCRWLQHKRDWEFSTPRGLEIVAGAVQDFCQIAESIAFIGSGTTKVRDLRFPCTTSLDLRCSELDDLDFIGKRFPALKQFRTFTALSTKLSGSLKSLPFVEDLDIIGGRLNRDIIGDSADLQNIKNLALALPSLTFSIGEFSSLQSLRLVMPLSSLRDALDNDGKEFNFTLLQARVVIRASPRDGHSLQSYSPLVTSAVSENSCYPSTCPYIGPSHSQSAIRRNSWRISRTFGT